MVTAGFRPEMIDSLYATAHKAALAQKNKAVAAANEDVHHGGDRKSPAYQESIKHDNNKNDVMLDCEILSQGNAAAYALRRLKKAKHDDLHAQCLAGELTPHAAMVQAGFRQKSPSRKRTPLEALYAAWESVSPDDQARFLIERLTPAQRPPPPVPETRVAILERSSIPGWPQRFLQPRRSGDYANHRSLDVSAGQGEN
jgi:hypothetical protein